MAIDETKRFTFVSQGLPEDTFAVVEFKGTEEISRLYEFDITLASDDPEIDLKGVLQNPATLTIKGGDQDFLIHGILGQFEQLHEVKERYFYRALLVPRLWQADLYRENQLFLDETVPNIIEEILKQTGLTTQDYELKLTKNYPQWEYICQYRETDFDFISRWMEREGIYFFFQQDEDNEKLIIADSSTAHEDIRGDSNIPFSPPSGIMPEKEAITAFMCRQKRLPNKVILRDYNYRKPSLDLKAEAEVDSSGRGNVYFYGEHFKTPEQGNELAKIRAEEIKCREGVYHGESTAPNLCPGFFYELEDHYRQGYNRKYLIIEVEHEGHQAGSLWAGVGEELAEGEHKLTYTNRFAAIPSDVQFRPERKTPKSRFYGTMNARIDAAGEGQYAELDDQGRYKVKLPFDQGVRDGGKASRWIRMAQPYAGAEHGMHFPLHKGTEVLLSFVDGDPDRPIIAGAVPNTETASPVTAANQSESVIQTGGNNKIRIEDKLGTERIIMESPAANSWFRIGAPNDPPAPRRASEETKFIEDKDQTNGIRIYTDGDFVEEAEGSFKLRAGANYEEQIGVGDRGSSYKFDPTPPKKGVFVNGDYERITANKYTEQTGTNDPIDTSKFKSANLKKGVYVKGDNEVVATGDCVIRAKNGPNELIIELKDDQMKIDTGGRDLYINCAHFTVDNSEEDNITHGNDFALHAGAAEEFFFGEKFELMAGTSQEISIAPLALEAFLGAKLEFSFIESLEFFLGFKQEFSFGHCFELSAVAKHEMNFGSTMEFNKGIGFLNSDVVFENKVLLLAKDNLKVENSNLVIMS
jgi:type VI secretion system VgrG family protein